MKLVFLTLLENNMKAFYNDWSLILRTMSDSLIQFSILYKLEDVNYCG